MTTSALEVGVLERWICPTGATWNQSGIIFVGHQGGNGILNLTGTSSGGPTITTTGLHIGNSENAGATSGVVNVAGYNAANQAVLNCNGDAYVGANSGGAGTLTVGAYSQVNFATTLQVGYGAQTGAVNMTGGTITVGEFLPRRIGQS